MGITMRQPKRKRMDIEKETEECGINKNKEGEKTIK